MRIDQLKQVIKIAECGSFSKAASELYISQSNLSLSIKNLETETEHQIFDRIPTGVKLTSFGNEFLNHALATYKQYEITNEFCKTYNSPSRLHFSASGQYLRFANLAFIKLFNTYNTYDKDFSFRENSLLEVINDVLLNRSEIGVIVLSESQKKTTYNLFKGHGLSYHYLATCSGSVTVGPNNPLFNTNQNEISLKEIEDYPAVMYDQAVFDFATVLSIFNFNTYKNRITVSDRNTLHEILEFTNAYSITVNTNLISHSELYYKNLRSIPLKEPYLSFELGWISNKGYKLSKLAEEYLSIINTEFISNLT